MFQDKICQTKMRAFLTFLISLHLFISRVQSFYVTKVQSHPLLPDKTYSCCKQEPYRSSRDSPVIYCYYGSPKNILNIWQTVSVFIDLSPEMYELYEGQDSQEVLSQFEAHQSTWSFNIINFGRKPIKLQPFNYTCLGIRTDHDYTLKLHVTDIDYRLVAMFVFGVLIFFLSPSLANNPIFYYLTGISIGVLASILIMFYFVLKLLPLKKPAMFGVIAGGSAMAFYLFQTFYDNITLLIFMYKEYVVCYLLLSALISFVVCYRFGPVSNPRSINLIKWSMQVSALILIFFSSYLREFSISADILLLSLYNIPILRWIGYVSKMSKHLTFRSGSHPRFLSEEEYKVQGERETARGLEDLRSYCNSPECRHWQTVLRLHDPHRFANFMEGKTHLTEEEVELYEEETKRINYELLTDDSDED